MYQRHIIGKYGEDVAVRFLEQKGYKIIERNFSCRQGELDIIARNNEYIVFIEVKTRSNFLYGTPIEAVGKNKQKHIFRVAKYYLHIHRLENHFVRFDVIEVFIDRGIAKVNHIKQVM
ncbi:MAG: YraN family protein [Clostridia bacterium]|nr:YraN family protein [Clostridia bacterium]